MAFAEDEAVARSDLRLSRIVVEAVEIEPDENIHTRQRGPDMRSLAEVRHANDFRTHLASHGLQLVRRHRSALRASNPRFPAFQDSSIRPRPVCFKAGITFFFQPAGRGAIFIQ